MSFTFQLKLLVSLTVLVFSQIVASQSTADLIRSTIQENVNYVYLPVTELGLANRLRIMASLYSVIVQSPDANRKTLVVLWMPNYDCPVAFDDLFRTYSLPNFLLVTFPQQESGKLENEFKESLTTVASELSLTFKQAYYRDFLINANTLDAALNLVWTRGAHAVDSMSCYDYLYSKSLFYQSLKPVGSVLDIVRTIKFEHFIGNYVVGIHIRAYDYRFDWPVVQPVEISYNNRILRFDEASTLESFIEIIGKIVQHTNRKVFLTSNSIYAKNEIVRQFGSDKIITIASSAVEDRDSVDGMLLALAEFYLLGESAYIIHTRSSSFAREAGSLLMRPVLDLITVGSSSVLFYTLNLYLAHCSSPDFIRSAYSTSGEARNRYCYYEEDIREICTVSYTVCPCSTHMILPGLQVYCNTQIVEPGKNDRTTSYHYVGVDGNRISSFEECFEVIAETNGYSI